LSTLTNTSMVIILPYEIGRTQFASALLTLSLIYGLIHSQALKGRSRLILQQREPPVGVRRCADWLKYIPEPRAEMHTHVC
jgi:hypothetical protein